MHKIFIATFSQCCQIPGLQPYKIKVLVLDPISCLLMCCEVNFVQLMIAVFVMLFCPLPTLLLGKPTLFCSLQ